MYSFRSLLSPKLKTFLWLESFQKSRTKKRPLLLARSVDLLKQGNNLQTWEFIKDMHANSLIPLIYKPTRETKTTATLIDNVFTNNYNVNGLSLQGLLITDISDPLIHLNYHIWDKPWLETDQYQLIRLGSETRLAEYKETISTTDWSTFRQYNSCEVYFTHSFNKMK